MKHFYLSVFLLFFSFQTWAQNSELRQKVQTYLNAEANKLGLVSTDFEDLTVQTNYTNEKTQVEYAYIQQNVGGYPIYNAIANFALKNGEIVHLSETFQKNVQLRLGNQSAISDVNTIAGMIAQNLGFTLNETAFLNEEFGSKLMYYPTEDGKLNLSWIIHLNVKMDGEQKILEVIAHAQTGVIYDQHNHLLSCNFDHNPYENPMTEFKQSENIQWLKKQYKSTISLNDNAQYRVYELPVEAPTFGDRSMVINPADPDASPWGWHDTNGATGPEFTHTQGNNVIAVNDLTSDGISWLYFGDPYTFTGFAEGGEDLIFDFPINETQTLYASADASTTNLFYMNNMIHDVWYQYGFTEAAGNFQSNNYGNGGAGSDEVQAFGQTGESIGEMNNARFGTPADGGNPFMIMFMWSSGTGDNSLFSINTSGEFEGDYVGEKAQFGAVLNLPPTTENLAVVIDDNAGGGVDANDACENITNAGQLNGKIALIKRGNCDFDVKVKKAENAGAVAVVMVNNVAGAPIQMGGDDYSIEIPSVMISMDDGNPIITAVLGGTTLNGSVPIENYNDGYKDGSIDNGVIAHEYGHGISNRLTGGPANSGCLNNEEQMGEGWSDYNALIMTMVPGDQGSDGRGIATYALSQPTTGVGLRPTRYSTDMAINNATYDRIKTVSVPHGVGYVWATMIWEMTWELIDEYGFDPDLYHGTGGNNLSMQLVADGMKLQPCSPGFVNGRDAILEADEINNEGANQCYIWKAFSKRGLGYSATQGSSNNVLDGVQAFDMPPTEVLDCSEILGVEDLTNSQLSIYPNPTRGEFYILTDKSYGDSEISIQDMTGKTVYSTQLNLQNKRGTVDVSSLPTGVYVVTIQTTEGKITKKLIKK